MLVALFATTLFLSAFLIFLVQPMFAKMILPLLGGTPSVWNTCMLFFQAALLAGYAYAHASTAWLSVKRQALVHVGLVLLPLVALPIGLPAGAAPPTDAHPVIWLLGILGLVVGLPFFAASTSAPLLQSWFATTRHPAARDPYFLYVASNAGSLGALLSYPLIVEPHLRLADQARLWTAGYVAWLFFVVACGAVIWRSAPASRGGLGGGLTASPPTQATPLPHAQSPTMGRRLRWVLLAFIPSSLLLGVTTYLSTDIAAVPLLWVIPLALYLLTFVLVFARRPPLSHALMIRALTVAVLPLMILIVSKHLKLSWVLIPLHLLTFFLAAMVCHGELARDRPPTRFLTAFYIWMSVGGFLGGVFNALIAPLVFDRITEYPLAIVLACLMRPGVESKPAHRYSRILDYAMPLALGAMVAAYLLNLQPIGLASPPALVLFGVTALACYTFRHRPIRFGLGVAAFLLVGLFTTMTWEYVVLTTRSFFGIYQVSRRGGRGGDYHSLHHGTTLHGMQSLDPSRRREPLTYYHPTGPLGQVFEAFEGETPRLVRVAAIGLGTASIACYASPGQQWTFYEIDPTVQRIAQDPRYFTYLRDCLERAQYLLGDARISLTRAQEQHYDLIVVDAFSSDAIPVHLLTQEALALYLAKLSPRGLIAVHVSNRHLELEPVVGSLAGTLGLVALARHELVKLGGTEEFPGKTSSQWVVVAREMADFGPMARDPRWRPAQTHPQIVWTDDFSNLLSVFRWR